MSAWACFFGSSSATTTRLLDFLFKADASEIGSVALVQLGENSDIGFLAIGSTSADRFHPGMSMDFLSRVGDLVAAALKRY